ncbi:hypothetical protein RFI_27231 [Reticulomyxa filosa]|uniref:DH domain-containing protein n=1 Tax=Reticulomyxa filosa TaxID=46433 RepID=X6MAS9_RETFI|nr:hypothetical protein RFI_27231 [Reticulomyxa filosa]|eukprot:ETO10145.1 hypothetical protein RFI_27231 [Reticulomyxa filosa]
MLQNFLINLINHYMKTYKKSILYHMSSLSDNEAEKIKLLREKCNYELLKSENEYVNMLEVLVKNIFKPLHENCEKLGLKRGEVGICIEKGYRREGRKGISFNSSENKIRKKNNDDVDEKVQFVYSYLEHMLQFHLNFLSVTGDALDIVPDFCKYSNFVQMYDDYLERFDKVLKVFADWKSMQFRSFINMRLENEKVKKYIEAPMLCMLPWYGHRSCLFLYLYFPFDRLKVYYKFLRDLQSLSKEGDEDKKFLDDSFPKFRKVYQKIKQS